jgi:hypothetical protein
MNTCSTPLDLARQYFIWPGALMQSKGKKTKTHFFKERNASDIVTKKENI